MRTRARGNIDRQIQSSHRRGRCLFKQRCRQNCPVEIQPSWAALKGDSIQYTFLGYDWDSVDSWELRGESAEWTLDVSRAGRYEVVISYGCNHESAGGRMKLTAAKSSLEFVATPTPSADVFEVKTLGRLTLPQGRVQLKAEVIEANGDELNATEQDMVAETISA